MSAQHFTGRQVELEVLTRLSKNQIANLVAIFSAKNKVKSRRKNRFTHPNKVQLLLCLRNKIS